MMKLVQLFMQRPSDKTIRIGRILFGLLIAGTAYYNLIYLNNSLDKSALYIDITTYELYIKYLIVGIGAIPVIMGIFLSFCIAKKSITRIIQIIFGILLMIIGADVMKDYPDLNIDILFVVLGLLPLLAGITGKCISSKCLKYKEKITKIRV